MAADKMKEILKHFPDLEEGWKEMEEKLKAEPAEREMLSLKYREILQRESSKESLVESEFTKTKRAESDLKVMKANEKSKFVYPDKLYARTNDNITLDISYAPQTLEAVEYTRTDAFIEKALKWYCLDCECNDNCKFTKCFFYNTYKRYLEGDTNCLPPKFSDTILNEDGSTSDNWRYRHFIAKMQDAFVEKAKKWFEEHFGNRLKWEITTYEFEDMQSMVEDFRNYMEGE